MGRGWNVRWYGALGEERMINDFMQRWALRGVGREDLLDQILGIGRWGAVGWELVFVVPNSPAEQKSVLNRRSVAKFLLVNCFDVLRLERWPANDKGINNDTNTPCIDLETVSICSIEQNFRGNIVRCPTNRFLPFALLFD